MRHQVSLKNEISRKLLLCNLSIHPLNNQVKMNNWINENMKVKALIHSFANGQYFVSNPIVYVTQ